jgi:two-component system, OmpR family, phosphate regulon sensor histidine kinase PhoR
VTLGVRGKLFFASLLAMSLVGLASGLYLEDELEALLLHRIEEELIRHARAGRDLIELVDPDPTIDAVDPIADRLGISLGARVTILDRDGRVLGDSHVTTDGVSAMENHGRRHEIVMLERQDVAVARRYSTTLVTSMMYAAILHRAERGGGFIRVAVPLSEVEASVAHLRWLLAAGMVVALALAVFMSALGSHFAARAGRLAASYSQVIDALEDMTEGVISLDDHKQIVRANRAALEMLGIDAASGRPLSEVVQSPELLSIVGVADAASTEIDLGARSVLARASPLRSTSGRLVVLHDVTEMRRLEVVRRDFVANVSHELRTPVAVIQANAETLLAGAMDDPSHAKTFLEAVHRNAERMSAIIGDLLDLSRIEAGQYEIELGPTEIAPIATRVLENLEAQARAKRIQVEIDIASDLSAHADPEALDHVLQNLLENALKYTPDGGRVTVRAEKVGPSVRIEVEDDGPGIEPKHRSRVFERFYRVDKGRSREVGGTGLGLSIVKHLVSAMGGTVGLAPADPKGSIFWLTLPDRARATPDPNPLR